MNILLLNTYRNGGAGNACARLHHALTKSGHSVRFRTAEDFGFRWPFYAERLSFLPHEHDASVRFAFSLANFGKNILGHPDVQWADVLHLHWVNQGFLSLEGIGKLAKSGKKIVWTLHDMWAFTGGCHYSQGCTNFLDSCGNCLYLKKPHDQDLSYKVWEQKKRHFPKNIQFVACSAWLADIAKSSGLLKGFQVTNVPNPIDIEIFCPVSDEEKWVLREKNGLAKSDFTILFVAMNTTEVRKGFAYLLSALHILKKKQPDIPVQIVVMGKASPEVLEQLPFPSKGLGLLSDIKKIVETYALSDVFIIPSLEDNLPNTVMESLACGTPVVGFDTGGIPEMAKHQVNGYIAPQRDAEALAEGLVWVREEERLKGLRQAARAHVEANYAEAVVAAQYVDLYGGSIKSEKGVN